GTAQALSQLAAAEAEYNRTQHSYTQASTSDIDLARSNIESATATYNRARADLERMRPLAAKAEISQQQFDSYVAAERVAAAELQLNYTTVVAPIEGEVTRKTVEIGQYVQAGQSLMTIVPLHRVWVTANFKETQLAGVQPGQRAEVTVDMYGKKIDGRVDS